MTGLVAELAERGRSLALKDRSRLVELLLETLHEPPLAEVEAAWNKEIERRIAAHERGEVETFAAEDVFAEARRIAPRKVRNTQINCGVLIDAVAADHRMQECWPQRFPVGKK